MPDKIEVIIVDEHAGYRNALTRISKNNQFNIIESFKTKTEFLDSKILSIHCPDLLIMTFIRTKHENLEVLCWIKKNYPLVEVVALTLFQHYLPPKKLVETGIDGLLIKSKNDSGEIVNALNKIHSGETIFQL